MKKRIILPVAMLLLLAMLVSVCAACTSTPSAEKLQQKFKDEGYEVHVATKDEISSMLEKAEEKLEIETYMACSKDGGFAIVAIFANKADAQKSYDDTLKSMKEYGEESGYGVEIRGKAVCTGPAAALEIFKKA